MLHNKSQSRSLILARSRSPDFLRPELESWTGLYLECSGRGVTGEQGVWGRKSPSGVQGQSPGGGLGAMPPEAVGTM